MMAVSEKQKSLKILAFLPLVALSVDLLTPFLIWKGVIPASVRWGSHAVIALVILLCILRMFSFDHFPRAIWLVVAVSVVWTLVALAHRQGIPSTVWGVWLLLQFPVFCLFAYLQPNPSPSLAFDIKKYALILLALEVIVQLAQYALGEIPGDNLAGLFARGGTGIALVFTLLVNCIFFGEWIVSRQWKGLVASLSLGLLSSVLGEVKMFPTAIGIVGLAAAVIYAVRHRSFRSFINLLSLILVAVGCFIILYNNIVPDAERVPLQSYLENPARLWRYLNFSVSSYSEDGTRSSDFGRMYAVQLGWQSISTDPVTFLFGYGIGARSESRTLGATGVALTSGDFGWSTGTSLLIMLQEMGFIGLLVLGGLIVWILLALAHDIRVKPDSSFASLRYAMIFFTMLLPILLWYANVWIMRVPMLSYWYLLGYVLSEARKPVLCIKEIRTQLQAQAA